jgi:hypothetical protein
VAFTSTPQYESYCTLVAEGKQNSSGSLRRVGGILSSLAGVNLDLNGSGSITPEFYPNIAASTPFLLEILETPVYYQSMDSTVSTRYYFENSSSFSFLNTIKEYTLGLPGKIKELIKGEPNTNTTNKIPRTLFEVQ